MSKSKYHFRVAKIWGKYRVCRFGYTLGWVKASDHEEALEKVCNKIGIAIPKDFVEAG